MSRGGPPRLARWLLRIQRLGERRAEVEADLLELFVLRARTRGTRHARRRYYADVLSLWRSPAMPDSKPSPARARFRAFREVGQDLTYAARLLRRSPGVVAVTIAGLAIAISVSTSVFSVLDAVAFRRTGIDDPLSVVEVDRRYENGTSTVWPYSLYTQLRDTATTIRLESETPDKVAFTEQPNADPTEPVSLRFVSGGYLEALSRRAAVGRLLALTDDIIGAPPAVVVSHRFWSYRLGADPMVIGRPIWLNGVAFTVVGVSERRFAGTSATPPAFWAPFATYHLVSGGAAIDREASIDVNVVGRVRAGVVLTQAETQLSTIASAFDNARDPVSGARLRPAGGLGPSQRASVAVVVAIVGVVIGLLLLLACVNAASLLLASTLSRAREMGVRLAVGASRARIVRQLLTESLSLGLAAGATGLLMTVWLVPALVVFVRLPIEVDAAPDWLVYSFLVAMSLLSGLGAGLAPVRRVLRDDLASPLKGLGARSDGSAPRPRLRTALVGVQAAASIMLLVLAALLTRGMVRATEVDIGFDADRLLVISPAFGREDDDNVRARAYWDVALQRVRGVAGVQAVSLAEYPPFGGGHHVQILNRPGGPYTIYHNKTQADYFATLGLRTIRGRAYTLQEVAGHVQVAVISDALARDFFPGEDPVGQSLDRIDVGSRRTIIGVVSNALTSRLRELNAAAIYQPLEDPRPASLVVRTEGPPQNLTQSLRSALQPLDPGLRLDIRPVSDGLQDELDQPRMLAMLAGTLAAIALGLALVGTYGVTAFVVGQRRQEIGIRIALGATVRDIMRLLLGDSMRPVVVGLAAGMSSALLGSRVLSGVLYGVPSSDPLAFGASALVLFAAAATAVIVPTRRAARLDPASVLREG